MDISVSVGKKEIECQSFMMPYWSNLTEQIWRAVLSGAVNMC